MIISLWPPKNGPYTVEKGLSDDVCHRCCSSIHPEDVDAAGRKYCVQCQSFGLVREDTLLYQWERPLSKKNHILSLPFSLSGPQKEASRFVLNCLEERKTGFLRAVCGAGKTEILCDSFLWGLKSNLRVCLAIPRKDIVMELATRLQKVFPNSTVKALYEQAKDDSEADIVVSTVHQLIRYHREFDWIVVDEADAFPYQGDDYLNRLVRKALKPDGILFQMSATADPEKNRFFWSPKKPFHQMPARFHGFGLDVPSFRRVPELGSSILKKRILPPVIQEWLEEEQQKGRCALLFVPTIGFGETLWELMDQAGISAGSVSSHSVDRKELIEAFRRRKWSFLVTTTILERGVTFKNIDVAVVGADQGLFDADTLVQISGRSGRDPDHPHGQVIFFSEETTKAMASAVRRVKANNKSARKAGLLPNEM